MRVVFYSPFMQPDPEAASGAARVGALFQRALSAAGAAVMCPALPLTRDAHGDACVQEAARVASVAAAGQLLELIASGAMARPDAWFSYHVYYKAPDWIGPAVSAQLGIPYIVAEGSHAPKRAAGPWLSGHAAATRALEKAHLLLAMTDFDQKCLAALQPTRVVDFKPFIDTADHLRPAGEKTFSGRLLSVGMMRDARKLESFRLVAETLALLPSGCCSLVIAGDGRFRSQVEGLFANAGQHHAVQFQGQVSAAQVYALMDESDLLFWPGIGEAYGLAYLEAQARGLPVIACRNRGVGDVMREGITALLSPAGDCNGLARSIIDIASDRARYLDMRTAAQAFVHDERSLARASMQLRHLLEGLQA